jgi:hypothetical protein
VHHRWGDGDGDADHRVYDRGGYGVYDGGGYGDYGSGSYGNNRPWFGGAGYNGAYNFGYQDGSSVAREDIAKGKPYNPNPRGRYDDEDHGYHREYGDKNAYKAQYANGYRAGYESVFGHRRGYLRVDGWLVVSRELLVPLGQKAAGIPAACLNIRTAIPGRVGRQSLFDQRPTTNDP